MTAILLILKIRQDGKANQKTGNAPEKYLCRMCCRPRLQTVYRQETAQREIRRNQKRQNRHRPFSL